MAEKAGKAAPAMAIAGALVASPQASQALVSPVTVATAQAPQPVSHQQSANAVLDSVASHSSITTIAASARHAAARSAARSINYRVRTGDTLSIIAERYYHNPDGWPWLYHENDKAIRDPNLIYTGQTLVVPASLPAGYSPASYIPRHAAPSAGSVADLASAATPSSPDASTGAKSVSSHASSGTASDSRSGAPIGSSGGGRGHLGGQLNCSGLEDLWDYAGGNPSDAFLAAEVAMAESGGNQYALSPTDDYGYWQINASHGPGMATFDPLGNARAAISISDDGSNWSAWTTYTSGAYIGQC